MGTLWSVRGTERYDACCGDSLSSIEIDRQDAADAGPGA